MPKNGFLHLTFGVGPKTKVAWTALKVIQIYEEWLVYIQADNRKQAKTSIVEPIAASCSFMYTAFTFKEVVTEQSQVNV